MSAFCRAGSVCRLQINCLPDVRRESILVKLEDPEYSDSFSTVSVLEQSAIPQPPANARGDVQNFCFTPPKHHNKRVSFENTTQEVTLGL